MADLGAWGAAATAVAGAVATVVAAARQPGDVATLKADVKAAREEVGPAIEKAVRAVAEAFNESIGKVRGDLSSVAKRVGVLEEWRKNIREQPRAPITSGPDILALKDAEHERRIALLEAQQERSEARQDRTDAALGDAREKLAGILGTVQEILRRAP